MGSLTIACKRHMTLNVYNPTKLQRNKPALLQKAHRDMPYPESYKEHVTEWGRKPRSPESYYNPQTMLPLSPEHVRC